MAEDQATSAGVQNELAPPAEASSSTSKKEPRTMQDMKQAFKKMGTSSSQMIRTSIKTLRGADGKTENADAYADTIDEGICQLKTLVEEAKKSNDKSVAKWDLKSVPLTTFNKQLDDLFVPFVKWAIVEDESGDNKDDTTQELGGKYNVSKAFRRLESYAAWMEKHGSKLENLTTESVHDAFLVYKLKISHDKYQRLVWWVDVTAMDLPAIKAKEYTESLRLFVWFAHLIMFDSGGQDNGMVFAENMGQIKFWNGMTLIPPKLSLELDRLTIGVLPVKMKKLYMLENPKWCDVLINVMKPFLSKKMKSRIVIVKENSVLEEELGKDCIPEGFASCDGQLKADYVSDKYFPNAPKTDAAEKDADL